MAIDIDEYLLEASEYAVEFLDENNYDFLDRLELTVMCLCVREGIELEDYDTG